MNDTDDPKRPATPEGAPEERPAATEDPVRPASREAAAAEAGEPPLARLEGGDSPRGRFLRGRANRSEVGAWVRRALLAGGDPEPWEPEATAPAAYAAAVRRARATAARRAETELAAEAAAEERVAALRGMPEAGWERAVRDDPRFHDWATVRELSRSAVATLHDRPDRAAALARLAVVASEAIEGGPESDRLRADLRALARGQRANAERVASDLRAAESAFRVAFEERERGTGDPVVHAVLEGLFASLRCDQGRYPEAVVLAERAARRYQRLGDRHGYGRIRLKQATFLAWQDELPRALATLDEALAHLDADAEPRLARVARHNRASYLDRLGRHDEAAAELEGLATGRDGTAAEPLDRVRWEWLAGRIALNRGEAEAGEALLRQARDRFAELGIGYDAALVGLELAALYARQGRAADTRRLAEMMVPIFASRDVHDHARAALGLWVGAARAEVSDLGLVQDLIAYLERARNRPDLSFETG